MGDLISRSQLLKQIETWGGCVEALHDYIQIMPTAYDIDKVVAELEERKALHERLVDYETKNGTVTEKYQHIKAIDVLNDAIEIVKQGIRKDISE